MSERLIALLVEPPNRQQRLLLALSGALLLHVGVILGLHFKSFFPPPPPMTYSLQVALIERAGGQLDATVGDILPVNTAQETPAAQTTPNPTVEAENQSVVSTTAAAHEQVARGQSGDALTEPQPDTATTEAIVLSATAVQATTPERPPAPQNTLQGNRSELSPRAQADNEDNAAQLEGFYAESWRLAVEQVASRQLPQRVREENLTGRLTLDVAINADGSVQSITMLKSSGNPALDRAARQIVYLAAPFEPFPPALRRLRDEIHIVRTWEFDRGSTLRARSNTALGSD